MADELEIDAAIEDPGEAPGLAPVYAPSPTAEEAIRAFANGPVTELRLVELEGARGEGKTTAGIWCCASLAERVIADGRSSALPLKVAVVRDTWVNLQRTTVDSFIQARAKGARIEFFNQQHDCILYDDEGFALCHFYFFGLDRPDQADNLQGFQCAVLWLEEIAPAATMSAGIPAEALGLGVTSVRQERIPGRILLTFNPPPPDHWVVTLEDTLANIPGMELQNIRIVRYVFTPGEKSAHFRALAEEAETDEERKAWTEAADAFDNYRARNLIFLEAIGRSDLASRLVKGHRVAVQEGEALVRSFSRAHHVAKQPIQILIGIPILRCWDFGLCYDDQTEVLTESGWALFRDLVGDERLATRHPESGGLEYQAPIRLVREPHAGPMLSYQNQNLDMVVTPEHLLPVFREYAGTGRWRTTTEKRTAAWLAARANPHAAVPLRAAWGGSDPHEAGTQKWTASVWARFCGWWLTEGSVRKGLVTIYQEKAAPGLVRLLAETGLPWREARAYGRRVGWRVWCPALADEVRGWNKRTPRPLTKMSIETIREFLGAVVAGDGHHRPGKDRVIFTASRGFADDLQEVAMLAGWYARITPRSAAVSRVIRDRQGREHRANGRGGYVVALKTKATRSCLIGSRWKTIDYRGARYCATVPNGTLYVRRNGIAHWNGNTPSTVWCQCGADWINILGSRRSDHDGMEQHILNHVLPFQEKYGIGRPKPGSGFGKGAKGGFEFEDIGDPAGLSMSPVNSEQTAARVIEAYLGTFFQPGPVEWSARREALQSAFWRKGGAGKRMFVQIDPDENEELIMSLDGRAHYPKDIRTGRIVETVEALKRASGKWFQSLDALGYGLAVKFPADEWLRARLREKAPSTPGQAPPGSWLGR